MLLSASTGTTIEFLCSVTAMRTVQDIPDSMPSSLSIVISAVYPTVPSVVVPDLSISVMVPLTVLSSESTVTSADCPFEMERMSFSSTETSTVILRSGQMENMFVLVVVEVSVEDDEEDCP